MTSLKTIKGDDIGKLLPKLEESINSKLRLIGRYEGSIILLRLLDAWEATSLQFAISVQREDRSRDSWTLAGYRYCQIMESEIVTALELLLVRGSARNPVLSVLPEFEVAISDSTDSEQLVSRAIQEGRLTPISEYSMFEYWMTFPINLAGTLRAQGLLIMTPGDADTKFFVIDVIWEMLRLLNSRLAAMTALRFKCGLVDREVRDFDFYRFEDITKLPQIDRVLTNDGFDHRSIEASAQSPEFWISNYRQIILDTYATIDKGLHSNENIEAVERQVTAIKDAYLGKIPKFDEHYLSHYGHSFENFVVTSRKLLLLSRKSPHTVYSDEKEKLTDDATFNGQISKGMIEQIINSMVWEPGRSFAEFPIVEVDERRIFQFDMILHAIGYRAKEVFDNDINNNPKGTVFEEQCRTITSDNGWATFPGRVQIPSDFMPDQPNTDVDIVTRLGRLVLIIECKHEKFHNDDRFQINNLSSQQNEFLKYCRQTFARAKWLANSKNVAQLGINDLESLLTPPTEGKPLLFIPLIVTTYPIHFPVENSRDTAIITIIELQKLLLTLGESFLILEGDSKRVDLSRIASIHREESAMVEGFSS